MKRSQFAPAVLVPWPAKSKIECTRVPAQTAWMKFASSWYLELEYKTGFTVSIRNWGGVFGLGRSHTVGIGKHTRPARALPDSTAQLRFKAGPRILIATSGCCGIVDRRMR